MHPSTALFGLATLATQVYSHGLVTSPAVREPGEATAAVCGQDMVDFYIEDPTSYPEFYLRMGGPGEGYDPELCNMWLCKGFQFDDNAENVMSFNPGDIVDMEVRIRIPHIGHANVSVVNTLTNTVVGEPLLEWPEGYADPDLFPDLPEDQTKFSITVPQVSPVCTQPGACVIQWYWWGEGEQTYESCIDFTVPEVPPERNPA